MSTTMRIIILLLMTSTIIGNNFEGSIGFSDPADGPVTTTFNWTESATDLLQISFGLKILF